jgi:hypothetical protein
VFCSLRIHRSAISPGHSVASKFANIRQSSLWQLLQRADEAVIDPSLGARQELGIFNWKLTTMETLVSLRLLRPISSRTIVIIPTSAGGNNFGAESSGQIVESAPSHSGTGDSMDIAGRDSIPVSRSISANAVAPGHSDFQSAFRSLHDTWRHQGSDLSLTRSPKPGFKVPASVRKDSNLELGCLKPRTLLCVLAAQRSSFRVLTFPIIL